MRRMNRVILSLVAGMALVGSLSLLGCGGGDEDGGGGGGTVSASPETVNNKSFSFTSGEVFDPGLKDIPTTLALSSNGTHFDIGATVDGAPRTASGTNQFGSCTFTVTSSNFPARIQRLQVGSQFTADPCLFNTNNSTLTITIGGFTVTGTLTVNTGTGGSGG